LSAGRIAARGATVDATDLGGRDVLTRLDHLMILVRVPGGPAAEHPNGAIGISRLEVAADAATATRGAYGPERRRT
jgi:hypothetical protein